MSFDKRKLSCALQRLSLTGEEETTRASQTYGFRSFYRGNCSNESVPKITKISCSKNVAIRIPIQDKVYQLLCLSLNEVNWLCCFGIYMFVHYFIGYFQNQDSCS